MKHAIIFAAVSMAALAGCITNPNDDQMMGAPPSAENVPAEPATPAANSPGSGMSNSGGGLSQNMTPAEAASAFRNLDTNHDGYLDRSEFTRYGDSGQRFPGCDTDGDGKLGETEYVACSQRPADTDQDG